jgi:hypothetical protein
MKNIKNYKDRFFSLLESEMGNVKPLIFEVETPTTLSPQDKQQVSSILWNKIQQTPELHQHLGIQPHHTESNFLNDVSHKFHTHIDPTQKHMTLEVPGLGKNHNVSVSLGASYGSHGGDDHGSHTPSFGKPHSVVDVGVKIPLSSLLKKS